MGADRARAAGKVFTELEDWRVFQHWTPDRVARVSESEYVQDHMREIANGGLKLFDKDTNRYATASRYEDMLKKAYSDIKDGRRNDRAVLERGPHVRVPAGAGGGGFVAQAAGQVRRRQRGHGGRRQPHRPHGPHHSPARDLRAHPDAIWRRRCGW